MQTIIIIGSSAAGLTAASLLCKISNVHVICLTKDAIAYNTCLLSGILSGKKNQEQSYLVVPQVAQGIFTIRYDIEVQAIKKDSKEIILTSGEIIAYDTLLITTGSKTRLLNASFYKETGVFTYHTFDDVIAIKKYINQHHISKAAVIGAGINGLECAVALTHLGIQVTILEKQDQILKNVIDPITAIAIEDLFVNNGLVIKKNITLEKIESNIHEKNLILSDGTYVSTELVIVAIGSMPNIDLAQESGLRMGEGILVNEYMQTSNEYIYAAGDCVEFFNIQEHKITRPTLWHDAIAQAITAAYTIAGQAKQYTGFIPTLHTNFFDRPLTVCGTINDAFLIKRKVHDNGYTVFFLNKLNMLQGFILWGHKESFVTYKKMISDRISFSIGIN